MRHLQASREILRRLLEQKDDDVIKLQSTVAEFEEEKAQYRQSVVEAAAIQQQQQDLINDLHGQISSLTEQLSTFQFDDSELQRSCSAPNVRSGSVATPAQSSR